MSTLNYIFIIAKKSLTLLLTNEFSYGLVFELKTHFQHCLKTKVYYNTKISEQFEDVVVDSYPVFAIYVRHGLKALDSRIIQIALKTFCKIESKFGLRFKKKA
jgi:hypothetical protein